jgi:hypothetical protein
VRNHNLRYGNVAPTKRRSEEFVVLASFDSRRSAERVVASLGRTFRKMARRDHASAFVISSNPDGSLKLIQSRAETAGDLTVIFMRISLALTVSFLGILSMLKGTKETGHAARARERHVGSDHTRGHEILGEACPDAGIILLRCSDQKTFEGVCARIGERAIYKWQGTREQFLGGLEPGSQYDWLRTALREQPS